METGIAFIGDEELNEDAAALIDPLLEDDEIPVAISGFDFETKVMAITDRRVIITSGEDGLVLNLRRRPHKHHRKGRKDAGDEDHDRGGTPP